MDSVNPSGGKLDVYGVVCDAEYVDCGRNSLSVDGGGSVPSPFSLLVCPPKGMRGLR